MLKQVSCKVKLFYENFLKLFENSEHSAVGIAGCCRARLSRHVKNPLPVPGNGQWHQPVSRLGISLGRIPAEAYFIPPGVV